MKKLLFLSSLITVVMLGQVGYAEEETVDSSTAEVLVSGPVTSSPAATSTASIGFSTKNIKEETTNPSDSSTTVSNSKVSQKPVGRLPSTGETVGMSLSILGLLLILIVFRKDLKAMIKNKKINSKENR